MLVCEKPIICLLLIWHVLRPLKIFISAFVCALVCVPKWGWVYERERERERERGGKGGIEGAIRVLLIHSIFVVAFIIFFFFSLLYVQYTYSRFVTKLTSLAVTRREVSSLIWKYVLFWKRWCKNDLIMRQWFSDTLISARPLRGSYNPRVSGLVSTPPWCSSRW